MFQLSRLCDHKQQQISYNNYTGGSLATDGEAYHLISTKMSSVSKKNEKEGDKNFTLEKPISGEKSQSMDAFTTFTIDSAVVRSSFKLRDQSNEQKTKMRRNSGSCNFIRQSKILLWMERIVLISICIAIAGGFTVPIIIYAADTYRSGNNTRSFSDFNFDGCQNATAHVQVCCNIAIYVRT